ncbi:hypothetical protein [Sphingobacterium deserti]|uniref:Uncharacterized protein n=1 Tax=Sphingobacterium deserti TaxID=1229276 RepID=A0A0B8TCU4_9SPHI|nr:hypothetical protein [Sphingobacterium deserti]KGE16190.1 hypothetical protein DI53_0023 [Sphingobacterium deserti]
MSDLFDIRRLMSLINRQWISFGKVYIMSIGIAAGVIAAFYGYAVKEFFYNFSAEPGFMKHLLSFRPVLFIFLGLLFVTIIAGTYFSDLGQKPKAIFEILIPASRLEKFITALFFSLFITMISYVLIYMVIDFGFVIYLRKAVASISLSDNDVANAAINSKVPFLSMKDFPARLPFFYFLPFLLSAIFLLGSIAFQNFQYIKTAISLIIFIAVWTITLVYLMNALTRNTMSVSDRGLWNEELNIFRLILGIGVFLTLVFWIIGFLRLKEKEV